MLNFSQQLISIKDFILKNGRNIQYLMEDTNIFPNTEFISQKI